MRKKTHILLCLITINNAFFSQSFPYKISRINDPACEFRVKVKDERPTDCYWGGNNYMYPVLVENFDFKEDLPNNWTFKQGTQNDDSWESGNDGLTWMGDPYNHGNVSTTGGTLFIETIKETTVGVPNTSLGPKTYDFTGGILNSIFGLRQGVFEARIRFPGDPNFFPAFWLNSKSPFDEEIDIVEHADGNIGGTPCDTYHQMKMTLHNRSIFGNSPDCSRSKKFPVASNYFNYYHTYKCVWTDYRVDIYLDGTLVGYATKYYDGPYFPADPCQYGGASGTPAFTRNCNYMATAQGCNLYYGWPINQCITWNKVDKDESFPQTIHPMRMILDAVINYHNQNYGTNLYNNWPSDINNRRMAVDWIKIYQPFECNVFRSVSDINDVKNITGGTNFLTADKIKVGTAANTTTFQNTMGFYYAGDEFPLHFLAASEIEINGDAIFEEGTYLRAEIVDCSLGFNESQRTSNSNEKLFLTDEEIAAIEQHQIDSMMLADPSFRDSINAYYSKNIEPIKEVKAKNDNGAIIIYPNPTNDFVYIDMEEGDFNDLLRIELTNNLGQKVIFTKTNKIDLQNYSSGVYYLKFVFSHGFIVDKKITK